MGLLYALVCATVFALWAGPITELFGEDALVQELAGVLLLAAALFQVGDAFYIVSRGILRGTGDVRFPAIVGIITSWSALPVSAWFLGFYLGFGALGAWIGITLETSVGAAILWWRLASGGWKIAAARSRATLAQENDSAPQMG